MENSEAMALLPVAVITFDIAGAADPTSMTEMIVLAAEMARA